VPVPEQNDVVGVERLLREAAPVIDKVLAQHGRSGSLLTPADVDDVRSAIHLRLLEKLRTPGETIRDYRGYVATLAYNVVHDFLRKRFPERTRLKNRVRHALSNDERLALWNVAAGPAGGLEAWNGRDDVLTHVALDPPGAEGADALVAMFMAVRQPVLVDGIVDFFDVPRARDSALVEDVTSHAPGVADELEHRDFVRALWEEIRQLRPMQRKALLLNLRYDGELDILSVLILSEIATLHGIAEVLEMTDDEVSAIWKELPLEDSSIAAMLGITRQQVINLRKAARGRLARRLPR